MELSVVMPNYIKTPRHLDLAKNAIFSIKESDLPEDTEFILVDDASPQGGGYIRSEADVYVRHDKGKGFSGAANSGLRLARGEYVLCTNNDVRPSKNFYKVAKEILDNNPDVISVHPRMVQYDSPLDLGGNTYLTGRERWCQSSFFIMRNLGYLFPEWGDLGGSYEDWFFWATIHAEKKWKTAYTTKACFQHEDSSVTNDPSAIASRGKTQERNAGYFEQRFGRTPEDHYNYLFSDQLAEDWRAFFNEL